MLLNEVFNYEIGKTKNGTPYAYIDPKTSEEVFRVKDIIKKHNGKWDSIGKKWFWWLSKNPQESKEIIEKYVYPAIIELSKEENTPQGALKRLPEETKNYLLNIINDIDTIISAPSNSANEDEIKNKVNSFKEKIVKITSSEEFKAVMGPIIKFRQALGHTFSWGNTILIWLQDPKATMVKSRSKWAKLNRLVQKDAPAIMLYSPVGLRPYTPEEKKEITAEFLRKCGVKSTKELNPGEKEKLTVKLSGTNPSSFKLTPSFFDHRFTVPMEGKEDLAPKANMDNIDWFDDKTAATEKTAVLYDAAIMSIEELGIKLTYVDDLDGARGVSVNGEIKVLTNSSKNIGDFSTLVHEFSHELLHQTYMKRRNETEYGAFFVGTKQGKRPN